MSQRTLDVDQIPRKATPITAQTSHESQPFGQVIHMPIALAGEVCKESVDTLRPTVRAD